VKIDLEVDDASFLLCFSSRRHLKLLHAINHSAINKIISGCKVLFSSLFFKKVRTVTVIEQ